MGKYIIKTMESEDEINGKGYVHYKSWHETYTGLVDAVYIERLTLINNCWKVTIDNIRRSLFTFFSWLEEEDYIIKSPMKRIHKVKTGQWQLEQSKKERLPNAEAFEPYQSLKERRYRYYWIYVKNFVIYYVVIDDEGPKKIMEVRRFLYNKQDCEHLV